MAREVVVERQRDRETLAPAAPARCGEELGGGDDTLEGGEMTGLAREQGRAHRRN